MSSFYGIYVREYLKDASVDFLRILFLQSEQPDGEWLVDPYIPDQICEFWDFFCRKCLNLPSNA